MTDVLDRYELKLDIFNFDEVPDEIIKNLIKDIDKEDVILSILLRAGYYENWEANEKKIKSIEYFSNLVDKIVRVSGFEFSNDELLVYKAFAAPINFDNIPDQSAMSDLINKYEYIDSIKVSGENLLYAQERVRYKLLFIYSNNISKYYDKMKDLLSRLKKNSKEYKKLEDIIYEKIK